MNIFSDLYNPAVAKNHLNYIDIAKGLCMMAIVLLHTNDFLGMTLTQDWHLDMAVQIFFFLSGVVYKNYGSFCVFIKKKTNGLLIPFAFFYIVTSVIIPNILYALGYHIRNAGVMGVKSLYAFASAPHAMFSNAPLWFLLCLFFVSLLFYGIDALATYVENITKLRWGKPITIIVLSFLGGALGFGLGKCDIGLYLYTDTALTMLPFYGCGYILKNYTQFLTCDLPKWILFMVMLVGASLVYKYTPGIRCCSNSFDGSFGLVYGTVGLGIITILCLSRILDSRPLLLLIWGRYSLIILCTHQLLVHTAMLFVRKIPTEMWLRCLIAMLFVMTFETLLIPIMVHFFPHVTAQKSIL